LVGERDGLGTGTVARDAPVPFGKETVVPLAVTVVVPALPLVLTAIPVEERVTRLLGELL